MWFNGACPGSLSLCLLLAISALGDKGFGVEICKQDNLAEVSMYPYRIYLGLKVVPM